MIKLVYDKGNCVWCPPEMGCLGMACDMCYETLLKCDECGEETSELYRDNNAKDFCESCMKKLFRCITIDNAGDYL